MNILYDLVFLRTIPAFKAALGHKPLIRDLGVLNFQHSEMRVERSLKNIGPVLGLWSYEEEIRHRRFSRGEWQQLLQYNAQDTHNTVLGIVELEKRIQHDWPNSAKLSDFAKRFYSDLIWSVVHLEESGVAFSQAAIDALETEQRGIMDRAYERARTMELILHGLGSATSKREFFDIIMTAWPEYRNDELLEFTPRQRLVSWGGQNRKFLLAKLPQDSVYRERLQLMDTHSKAQKLITSYVKPLKEKHLVNVRTYDGRVPMAFPSWHVFPGPFKDGGGTTGGTQQSRITATSPGLQTNPQAIKRCFRTRYRGGSLVASDLSQIELRVPGVLSGEPTFLRNYAEGGDLHTQRAIEVFGPDILQDPAFGSHDNERDPRQHSKMFNFADLYRAGAEKLRKLLLDETGRLFEPETIRRVVAQRPRLRPRFWEWQEQLLQVAGLTGNLVLPITGQSRYLDAHEDHNAILNFPIQTTAGNVLHRLKHRILPRLPAGVRCFADIYDALVFDHPRADEAVAEIDGIVQEAIVWIQEHDYWAMLQDHYGHVCPLEAETEILEVWSPPATGSPQENRTVQADVRQEHPALAR
jgi:hypothetical protein